MERINRDSMLMEIAITYSKRATCKRKKVGCIISIEGRCISAGYNGPPPHSPHCDLSHCNILLPCIRSIHAEANSLAFASKRGISVDGCTLYTTSSPCTNCAKLIISSGIVRVVYGSIHREEEGLDFLSKSGISLSHYKILENEKN